VSKGRGVGLLELDINITNDNIKEMSFYVYYYLNKITDTMYIGKGCRGRWHKHIAAAFSQPGQYTEERNSYLCRAIRKYGIENFEYGIFQYCVNEAEAYLLEEEWHDRLVEWGIKVYNLIRGGEGGQAGSKRSPETCQNISKGLLTHYEIWDSPRKGVPLTEEHKRAISEGSMGKFGTNTGKVFDKTWTINLSKSHAGKECLVARRFSEEVELEICRLYTEEYLSMYKLGQIYNCQRSLINHILQRHSITKRKSQYTGHSNGQNIFSLEQELEICSKYEEGNITRRALAKQFNCGITTIRGILLRNNIKLKRG
jgi:group I intron endonuclease